VLEIGNALRAARERQGLGLGEVERETRIRARYLAALEEERFEQLPARAYAKGFLRCYADFLGLDGRLIVTEFNERFPDDEQPELAPPRLRASPAAIRRRRLAALLLAGVAVVALGVLAWRFEGGRSGPASPGARPTTAVRAGALPAAAPPPLRPPPATASRPAHLVLRARGPCWLSIRASSAGGPVLYETTLDAGGVLRYTLAPARPRLWVRIGAPWNLELSLNGEPVAALPHAPVNIVVSRAGVRPA
jgi:helix-turn-helix protein/uncharacterized protein DUF4115